MSEEASNSDVFINCPFDADYKPIFEAIVFTIFACEFRPRCALELEDGSQTRIDKLYDIISACRYGVHDLSRTELDTKHKLPRFNMPLELGLFLGAKRYGDETQKSKRCLIMDVERFRYQKFISDLAGMDIRDHGGEVGQAIGCVRNWLANVSRRKLQSADELQNLYREFRSYVPAAAAHSRFDPDAIPYVDYENIVTAWLLEAPSRKKRKKKT